MSEVSELVSELVSECTHTQTHTHTHSSEVTIRNNTRSEETTAARAGVSARQSISPATLKIRVSEGEANKGKARVNE